MEKEIGAACLTIDLTSGNIALTNGSGAALGSASLRLGGWGAICDAIARESEDKKGPFFTGRRK